MTAKLSALSKIEDTVSFRKTLNSPESSVRRFKVANGSAIMPYATDYNSALDLYHSLLKRDSEDMTLVRVMYVREDGKEEECTECFPLPTQPRRMESYQERKERVGLIRLQGVALLSVITGKPIYR